MAQEQQRAALLQRRARRTTGEEIVKHLYPYGTPVPTDAQHQINILVALLMGGPQGTRVEDVLVTLARWVYEDAAKVAERGTPASFNIRDRAREMLPDVRT